MVLGLRDASENPEIMNMRGRITKSKSFTFKLKQNNTTELLNISLMKQLCDGDGDDRRVFLGKAMECATKSNCVLLQTSNKFRHWTHIN